MSFPRWTRYLAAGAVLSPLVGVGLAGPASAIDVSTEAQLRAAFADAAQTSIVLTADIDLVDCEEGQLLRAASAAPITISGGFTIRQTCTGERVISGGDEVNGELTVDGPTITGGNLTSAGFADGGGIFWLGDVTLLNATITANSASSQFGASAGGVFAGGELVVALSTFSENQATSTGTSSARAGAFIGNGGAVISASTIVDNSAGGGTSSGGNGGATFSNAPVTVLSSTFAGNVAEESTDATSGGNGGAIVINSDLSIVDSTFASNVAEGPGSSNGGVAAGGTTSIVYSTFVANSAASSANIQTLSLNEGPSDTIFGTVLAAPQGGGGNCGSGSEAVSAGYNYATDASCNLTATGDRQSAPAPGLGGLADNGGPTFTMLPGATSPLLDAIPVASCESGPAAGITVDQRGVTRPQGTGCDIGAVEVEVAPPPTSTTTSTPSTTTPGSTTSTTRPGTAPAATPVVANPRLAG